MKSIFLSFTESFARPISSEFIPVIERTEKFFAFESSTFPPPPPPPVSEKYIPVRELEPFPRLPFPAFPEI